MINISKKHIYIQTGKFRYFFRIKEKMPKGITFAIHTFVAVIILLVIAAFLLVPFAIHTWQHINYSDLGTYGDFFGSFTSLFTVLAFGGLIISLYFQRRDLELQRKELNAQVNEMKDQADAQKSQAEYLAKQFRLMGEQFNLSKYQLQLSRKQAFLMDKQVKSMVEQTEKEIRPYLNVYIDYNEYSYALIIKNVGRTACTDFSMSATLTGKFSEEDNDFVKFIQENLSDFHLDLIPAGMEYAVVLDDLENQKHLNSLYGKEACLEITFKFLGLGQEPKTFTVKYSLDEEKTPTRRSQVGSREICKHLNDLNRTIGGLRKDMASYVIGKYHH